MRLKFHRAGLRFQNSVAAVWARRLAVSAWLAAPCAGFAAPAVQLGSASGSPGETVLLPLVVQGASNVLAAQLELRYPPELRAEAPAIGEVGSGFRVTSREVQPGLQRIVFFSPAAQGMPDFIEFKAGFILPQKAAAGVVEIGITNVILADLNARPVASVSLNSGSITVVPASPAGPRFQMPQLTAEGLLQFQVTGTVGKSYILEVSPDLRNWSPHSTNVAVNGVFNLTETVGSREQFYRAVLAP